MELHQVFPTCAVFLRAVEKGLEKTIRKSYIIHVRRFQKSSKLSKRPRLDLQKGAFYRLRLKLRRDKPYQQLLSRHSRQATPDQTACNSSLRMSFLSSF